MHNFLGLADIFLVGLILSAAAVRDFQAQRGEHHLVKHSTRQTAWGSQAERKVFTPRPEIRTYDILKDLFV